MKVILLFDTLFGNTEIIATPEFPISTIVMATAVGSVVGILAAARHRGFIHRI